MQESKSRCIGDCVTVFKRLLVFMGLWVLSYAQEPFSLISELSISDLDSTISPTHISFLGGNKFVILDGKSRELILIDRNKIIHRIGSFGQGLESFSEPSDMIVQNLKVWISDRTERIIQQYDYLLNYVGEEWIDKTITYPFYTDILIYNPLGKPYIFSKTYGELWSLEEASWPFIDLNQLGLDGSNILDISSDDVGNLAVLTQFNMVLLFNRFGRLLKRIMIDLDEPIFVINFNHQWLVLNVKGMGRTIDSELLQTASLKDDEMIVDTDVTLQSMTVLTNQRILVYE